MAAELARRDRFDSTREISPLRPAASAIEIDTSNMSVQAAIVSAVSAVDSKLAVGRDGRHQL